MMGKEAVTEAGTIIKTVMGRQQRDLEKVIVGIRGYHEPLGSHIEVVVQREQKPQSSFSAKTTDMRDPRPRSVPCRCGHADL